MNENERLIFHFYTCFQNKDVKGMQECYSDSATFSDPVFSNLDANEVKSMWAMLLQSGKDMRIEFGNIKASGNRVSANWDAWYTFSATGNKVLNRIKANFIVEEGKILAHVDDFSFYKWAKQALGFTGFLLGRTSFLKNKIRTKARKNLDIFIASVVN